MGFHDDPRPDPARRRARVGDAQQPPQPRRKAAHRGGDAHPPRTGRPRPEGARGGGRSEEHTSELQSLMRISYAVFCLKKKKTKGEQEKEHTNTCTNIKRKENTEK